MAAHMQRMRLRRSEQEQVDGQQPAAAAPSTADRGFARTLADARQALRPADLRMSGSRGRDEQQADQAAAGNGPLAPQLQVADQAPAATAVPRAVADELRSRQGGGSALDPQLAVSTGAGAQVRIHTDERADRLSRSLDAQAFTHGRDIFFARGAYAPQTTAGRQLIGHELHHAATQAQSGTPMIQRKLVITRAGLISATGDKGAMVWSTSSYEKLLDVLAAYEKLDKADPQGARADTRSELLLQIINLAKAWLLSDRRAFNDPTGKVKARKGDEIKQDMLGDLIVEAQDEYRKYLLNIEKPEPAEPAAAAPKAAEPAAEEDAAAAPAPAEISAAVADEGSGAPAAPRAARARRGGIMLSETSQSAQQARQRAAAASVVQKGFFARTGDRLKQFLHYTFGTDFTRQTGTAAFDPKRTLSPSVIDTLIRLMDEADKTFDELVAAGVKPQVALHLAYREMPEQLRPKGNDPAARLALNVRKQYMLEAIKPAPTRGAVDTVSDVNTSVGEKVGLVKMAVSTAGGIAKGSGTLLDTVGAGGAAEKAAGAGAGIDTAAEHIGVLKAGSQALSGLIGGLRDTRDFISSVVGIFKAKTTVDRQIQTNAVLGVGMNLLANLSRLSSSVAKIVSTFGSELPGVKLIASALQGLDALINQIKTAIRSLREQSLAQEARRAGSGLAHVLGALSNRNMMLMFRNAVKAIANAVKMIGESLVLVPDPSGATQAAGKVTSIVASVVETAATVGALIEDSYRAGVAQESAQQAMAGERGADVKVLQDNSAWAVTALILEAKKEPPDTIAVRELGNYGLTPDRIQREPLERLRAFVLAEIVEFPEPQTITQKLIGLARTIKGGAEKAARGVGRAGAAVHDRWR